MACSGNYSPVCDSDGSTYSNEYKMRKAAYQKKPGNYPSSWWKMQNLNKSWWNYLLVPYPLDIFACVICFRLISFVIVDFYYVRFFFMFCQTEAIFTSPSFLRDFYHYDYLCIEEKNNFLPVRVWLTHFMTLFPFYTPWKHLHFLLFRGYRKGQVVRNRCVLKQSPKGVLWKRRS